MSLASKLLKAGAVQEKPLQYGKERPKVSGYMWVGSTTLKLGEITFYFEMYSHLHEEPKDEEEVLSHMGLKGINVDSHVDPNDSSLNRVGKFYDCYWYTIITDGKIFLHRKGWFNTDRELKEFVESIRSSLRRQDDSLTAEEERELLDKGFELLLDFSE